MRHHREYADLMYLDPLGPSHIVPWGQQISLCGIQGSVVDWYGTGSWDEREHAQWVTTCTDCLKAARTPGDQDPSVDAWREVLGG